MDFQKEFEFAKKVIQEAGKLVLSYAKKKIDVSYKEDYSFLTEADTATENFIYESLQKKFPSYGFIGEETEMDIKDTSWIVDPIDGTISYSRGIPEYGIALALKSDNKLIFSVQYLPYASKLLHAYTGYGAYCNGQKLSVGNVKDFKKAYLSIGYQNFWYPKYQQHTLNVLTKPTIHRFRVGGSSVVESYYLAGGRTDISIRFDQPIWDTAAEYLLMKEAGAVITNESGKPLHLHFDKTSLHNYIATNSFLRDIPYLFVA